MSPEEQLAGFLAKYTPEIVAQAEVILANMRARLPGAVEMVYDNYNWLVIGFGPNERASEAIFSIVLAPKWVTLCFLWGAYVPDPHRLLKGGGKQVRNIRLKGPETLDVPEVQELIAKALEQTGETMDRPERHKLVIKAISAKQRPRRPA
jgi:hypothetical protein